jgi:hypothetical protein
VIFDGSFDCGGCVHLICVKMQFFTRVFEPSRHGRDNHEDTYPGKHHAMFHGNRLAPVQ